MCLILSNTSQCVVYRMKDNFDKCNSMGQLYGLLFRFLSATLIRTFLMRPSCWEYVSFHTPNSLAILLWVVALNNDDAIHPEISWNNYLEVNSSRPTFNKAYIHPRIIGDSQMTVWKKYVSEVIFIGRERKLKNEENGTQENMLFFVTQYHQDLAKPKTIPTGNGTSLKANRTK